MAKAGAMRDAIKRRMDNQDNEPDMMPEMTNPNTDASDAVSTKERGDKEVVGAVPEAEGPEGHDYESAFEDLEACADRLPGPAKKEANALIDRLRKLFDMKEEAPEEPEGDMPTGTGNSPLGAY